MGQRSVFHALLGNMKAVGTNKVVISAHVNRVFVRLGVLYISNLNWRSAQPAQNFYTAMSWAQSYSRRSTARHDFNVRVRYHTSREAHLYSNRTVYVGTCVGDNVKDQIVRSFVARKCEPFGWTKREPTNGTSILFGDWCGSSFWLICAPRPWNTLVRKCFVRSFTRSFTPQNSPSCIEHGNNFRENIKSLLKQTKIDRHHGQIRGSQRW